MTPGQTRRRSLRSIVVRVAVFLLLGAVVNVAVAWGLSLPEPNETAFDGQFCTQEVGGWYFYQIGEAGRMIHFFHERPLADADASLHAPPQWSLMDNAPRDVGKFYSDAGFEVASGWPLLALTGHVRVSADIFVATPHFQIDERTWAIAHSAPGMYHVRVLPLFPIWPGFAINVFFYAAIPWLLFAALGSVRRWRRIRRGLCAKCAYPVGTSVLCTECGSAISRGSTGLPFPAPPAIGSESST